MASFKLIISKFFSIIEVFGATVASCNRYLQQQAKRGNTAPGICLGTFLFLNNLSVLTLLAFLSVAELCEFCMDGNYVLLGLDL